MAVRIRMVTCRGFATRYIAERMARAFRAHGCAVADHGPADLNFVYYRWMRKDGPVGRPRAIWLVDEPYQWPRSANWARPFDWIFVNDRAALGDHAPQRTFWLPPAYGAVDSVGADRGPRRRAIHSPPSTIHCDLAFVGAGFPNRRRLVKRLLPHLKGRDVRLVGPNWPGAWNPRDEWVSPEEAARYYAGAKINLNVHREPRGRRNGPRPTALNFRAFEIAAVGGFQIIDDRDDRRLFLPSCPTFDGTAQDLRRQVEYYLNHDDQRRDIAAACRREIAPHTFEARTSTVLQVTGRR